MVASPDSLVLISWRVTMMLSSFASEAWEVELELLGVAWLSCLVLFLCDLYLHWEYGCLLGLAVGMDSHLSKDARL